MNTPERDPSEERAARLLDEAADRLEQHAEAKGLPHDAFDGDVYDIAGDVALPELNAEEGQEEVISDFEHDASTINNGGFRTQFMFLLSGYGDLEDGERDLRRLIDERGKRQR